MQPNKSLKAVRMRSLDSPNRRMLRIVCAACVCPLALRQAFNPRKKQKIERLENKRELSMESIFAWAFPVLGIPASCCFLYGSKGKSKLYVYSISLITAIGFSLFLSLPSAFANTFCIEYLHVCKNHGDANMLYWFNSIFLVPVYCAFIIAGYYSGENKENA